MTATVPTTQSPLDNITYEDLYRRWENGNWRAMELDFAKDAEQWQTDFTAFERKAALWNYSMFFWGEDAVADGLSPYVDAAPPLQLRLRAQNPPMRPKFEDCNAMSLSCQAAQTGLTNCGGGRV